MRELRKDDKYVRVSSSGVVGGNAGERRSPLFSH